MNAVVINSEQEPLCVLVEPIGNDFWVERDRKLHFSADGRGDVEIVRHSQGLSLSFGDADAYGVTVTDESGSKVACGFGRPDGWPPGSA